MAGALPVDTAQLLRNQKLMKFLVAAILFAVAGLGIAYLAAPLQTFNALVPKDAGTSRIGADIPFGEHARQRLDIYASAQRPGSAPAPARPVLVFFYGGSWNSGIREGYGFAGRALAGAGDFVAVVPDYRLVPEARFPTFVEDGAEAVRWVRANIGQYGGDPDRIVLVGHSAGAYIAAMLANDPQWLGADRAGLRGMVGLAGPYDFHPWTSDAAREAFDAWPHPAETQPITYADAGAPPALLLTGEDDTTVRPRNSEALAARLRDAGVAAQVVQYPDIGHIAILLALSRPLRSQAPVLSDIARFAQGVTEPGTGPS